MDLLSLSTSEGESDEESLSNLKRVGIFGQIVCLLLGAGFFNIVYFHPELCGRFSDFANVFQIGWFNHQPILSFKSH